MLMNLISEDALYRRSFKRTTGPAIYREHIGCNYISCIFCAHLKKSQCHSYCFICSQSVYKECSLLLPGTYNFCDSYFDSLGTYFTPWIFKTACTRFERLKNNNYLRNFMASDRNVVTAGFEALEGLFTGMCRGKRPCHICASVNLEIYNNCSKAEKNIENKPCSRIKEEISNIYNSYSSMTIDAG